jgi:protein involved in polysaccharide export with SLBB domain
MIILLSTSVIFSQSSINRELDILKKELKAELDTSSTSKEMILDVDSLVSEPVALIPATIDVDSEPNPYFGYDYFKRKINFFDNTPTPSDYRLGPGDEITLSLWGEHNLRETFLINKEGLIYYENIGFINLSNITISEAEKLLKERLSAIYATLTSSTNSTKLMVELGKIKSINVYFSGELLNPGIHLVHPFSDIFGAIVQSGGLQQNGSLRTIQLIRKGEVISSIDFYSFFMNGKNNFSDIKLIDGDVIHIPSVKRRITIAGEVNRPSSYELLPDESLLDIVAYASGFTSKASSTLIVKQIIPVEKRLSDDNAMSSVTIDFKNKESVILNDGDSINVLSISAVHSTVEIFGRVKSPGEYPSTNAMLKDILDIAGGFDDPVYKLTIIDPIVVLRKDVNQFYSKTIFVRYEDAGQFKLEVDDQIFVYENANYKHSFTYRVEGEVAKPGTYPFYSTNLNIADVLELAGGLTELGSIENITIKQEFTSIDESGNVVIDSETVSDATLDFEIGINSVIIASPFENVVRVEGNVYNPGLITFKSGTKLSEYIHSAGGYKPDTMKRNVYVKRSNGNIEKTSRFFLIGKKIYAGDTIIVPVNLNPTEFDAAAFTADILSVLANLVAILAIADNRSSN